MIISVKLFLRLISGFRDMVLKNSFSAIKYYLFVFVALRPMSTAMVIAGRSVHLATLFPGQA